MSEGKEILRGQLFISQRVPEGPMEGQSFSVRVSEISPGRASPDRPWFGRGVWSQILPERVEGWWG